MQVELAPPWSNTLASNFGEPLSTRVQQNETELNNARSDQPSVPSFRFDELAQGSSRILIQYGEAVYELKCTRNGRLCLNK